MPRPDLSKERTKQILDAFEICVARYGLEGSSLERIGEEAGMKRTILRHYIGNREDLIRALCERMVGQWKDELKTLASAPVGKDLKASLINDLFRGISSGSESVRVAESLIAAVDQYAFISEILQQYIEDLTGVIAGRLAVLAPDVKPFKRWEVAYGITAILFNEVSLAALALPAKYPRASKACVAALIDSLSSES